MHLLKTAYRKCSESSKLKKTLNVKKSKMQSANRTLFAHVYAVM